VLKNPVCSAPGHTPETINKKKKKKEQQHAAQFDLLVYGSTEGNSMVTACKAFPCSQWNNEARSLLEG
jgi:hypothetical protein